MITVTIKTGTDIWAIMSFTDKERAIEETANKYAYARIKYDGEKTTIEGLSPEDVKIVKNKAKTIIDEWKKSISLQL